MSWAFQSVSAESEASLPKLPLPCIHAAATRVYFGHERRLAEGKTHWRTQTVHRSELIIINISVNFAVWTCHLLICIRLLKLNGECLH